MFKIEILAHIFTDAQTNGYAVTLQCPLLIRLLLFSKMNASVVSTCSLCKL